MRLSDALESYSEPELVKFENKQICGSGADCGPEIVTSLVRISDDVHDPVTV